MAAVEFFWATNPNYEVTVAAVFVFLLPSLLYGPLGLVLGTYSSLVSNEYVAKDISDREGLHPPSYIAPR